MYVDNAGVRLHVLDNGRRGDRPPVLVVPGMAERADEFGWLLDAFGDRRAVAVDVRGRGGSDAPPSGYAWEDHTGDLRAVVDELGLERPVLVAFSRGTPYALGLALQDPAAVSGLVVGDYVAGHVRPPDGIADRQLAFVLRGVPVPERMPEAAVRAVFAEGREVPLWDRLTELRCPVLVLRGDRRSTVLTDELVERWLAASPTARVVTIPGVGHDLWSRDKEAFLAVLRPFVDGLADGLADGLVDGI